MAMVRTPINADLSQFPSQFHTLLDGADVYDSSCSKAAKVYFIDKDGGFYLKTAQVGTLEKEAKLTQFFHEKGLSAQVLAYEQTQQDWLLTRRIPGEDCLHAQYTDDPKRLSELTGTLLRSLHETDIAGCPVPDRTGIYIENAVRNYYSENYDATLFPDNWGYASAQEAFAVVKEFSSALKTDTLLHGDYCLPNILLDNWHFTGFIDLDCAGAGDRHIDLFWGVWTLQFNLKTDAYGDRFLDAYGRDRVDTDILSSIGAFEVFG